MTKRAGTALFAYFVCPYEFINLSYDQTSWDCIVCMFCLSLWVYKFDLWLLQQNAVCNFHPSAFRQSSLMDRAGAHHRRTGLTLSLILEILIYNRSNRWPESTNQTFHTVPRWRSETMWSLNRTSSIPGVAVPISLPDFKTQHTLLLWQVMSQLHHLRRRRA